MKSKVAVLFCDEYSEEKVYQAIKNGIDLLGGLNEFIESDEQILLKPNLLNRADAGKAVTTHPVVFGAVARLLRENRCENLSYGDSPGHPGRVEKTAEICGIKEVADKYEIPLANFMSGETVEFRHGLVKRKFEVAQGALEADAIINICKMKTHQLERITGGVKNMFGCVYGFNKGASHAKYPDAENFAQMLVDLNILLKARLHIMDGIIAMEGNGPASGNPVKMNLILMSEDPVALDATFCRLIDLEPENVPTVLYGQISGLGCYKEDDIAILGVTDLKEYIKPDFDVSREKVFSGRWAVLRKLKVFDKKPAIIKNKCIRCGACIEACPVEGKAIRFPEKLQKDKDNHGRGSVPEYNYKKCIRCYCCQEMCPRKAIVVKRKVF